MHDSREESSSGISVAVVPNLYLIVLKFRFPPINLIEEAPNMLTYIPFHADSLLLFADIVRYYGNIDWRFDFVKVSYFRNFNREHPKSLIISKEYGVALSSVVLPVFRRTSDKMDLYLPTRYPRKLVLAVEENTVRLHRLARTDAVFHQERLWIRKRDDIPKLALINPNQIELRELKSSINARSGGYRAIDVTLKIPFEYLTVELAFFASVSNLEKLQEELITLKRSGVGKKRDMGFGDLISWEVYNVELDNKFLNIRDPMLIYSREDNIMHLITLRNLSTTILNGLRRLEKEKNRKIWFLPVNMKMILSRTKPPYWLSQEICIMPFSEFLLQIYQKL